MSLFFLCALRNPSLEQRAHQFRIKQVGCKHWTSVLAISIRTSTAIQRLHRRTIWMSWKLPYMLPAFPRFRQNRNFWTSRHVILPIWLVHSDLLAFMTSISCSRQPIRREVTGNQGTGSCFRLQTLTCIPLGCTALPCFVTSISGICWWWYSLLAQYTIVKWVGRGSYLDDLRRY